MRVDKQTLPIYISVALSLITFFTIWGLGGVGLLIIQKFLPVLFGVWILTFLLVLSVPKLKEIVSLSATTSAFIIYLGVLFISLARFKEEIAKGNIDINVLGVGLALIAIALVLTTQHREKQINDKDNNRSVQNSIIKASDETEETMTKQELPSIDIVLEEARRTLDFQFEQLDGLDTKSGVILGIAGVVITLLVSALIGMPNLSDSLIVKIIMAIIGITLFISLFLSYRNLRIGKWKKPPEIETLIKDYVSKDSHTTKCNIVGTMQKAVKENEGLLNKRIYLYKCSYNILFAGLVMVAISMIIFLFIL